MVIPLVIISAFGCISLVEWIGRVIKNKRILFTSYLLLTAIFVWDFTRYLHQYYVHMAKTYDYSSQYGFKEMMQYVMTNENKFSKVVITDRYDQPYILSLFYSKYPPAKFQQKHQLTARDQFGFSTVREYDKFVFKSIGTWDQARKDYPNSLIIGASDEIPEGANVLKTIYFPSGRIAFKVVEN